MEDIIQIAEEWLELKKYDFKILVITTILADEKRAFRGKLSVLCEYLEIGNSSANKNKIKSSLSFLEENNFIKTIVDKDVYTISLSKSIENTKHIISIKKAWYKLIRNNSGDASWENVLKVFLKIIELRNDQLITYQEIGETLGIKVNTVANCIKAIEKINFEDFIIRSNTHIKRREDGTYVTLGKTYEQMMAWGENK